MSTDTVEYVSPKELAEMFGISVRAVNALIQDGTIPVLSFGPRIRRINIKEAEQILRRGGGDD